MIEEAYISFETAKLLIRKGLNHSDCHCDSYYTLGGEVVYLKDKPNALNVAPRLTLSVAMRWLREVHNIDIITFHEKLPYNCYWARIERDLITEYQQKPIYESYEDALETAIQYTLENLI